MSKDVTFAECHKCSTHTPNADTLAVLFAALQQVVLLHIPLISTSGVFIRGSFMANVFKLYSGSCSYKLSTSLPSDSLFKDFFFIYSLKITGAKMDLENKPVLRTAVTLCLVVS